MDTTKNKLESEFMRHTRSVAPKHCDICGHKYEDTDFKLIGNQQKQQTSVHLKCSSCGNAYMLNIFSPFAGMVGTTKSKLNLDVENADELVEFAGKNVINMNEALDAYNSIVKTNWLEKFFKSRKL